MNKRLQSRTGDAIKNVILTSLQKIQITAAQVSTIVADRSYYYIDVSEVIAQTKAVFVKAHGVLYRV